MKSGKITAIILLVAGLAASAQTNLPPATSTNPPPPAIRRLPVSVSPLDRFLSADQRKVFDQAYLASQQKVHPLSLQVRQLRRDMSDMMFADKFDEAAFRAKSEAVGKLQTEIDLLMVQAVLTIRPTLTTNQIDSIRGPQTNLQVPPAGAPAGTTTTVPSKP